MSAVRVEVAPRLRVTIEFHLAKLAALRAALRGPSCAIPALAGVNYQFLFVEKLERAVTCGAAD